MIFQLQTNLVHIVLFNLVLRQSFILRLKFMLPLCIKFLKMRNILLIGAGRSASSLIRYLLEKSESEKLHITVGDLVLANALKITQNHPNT